MKMKLAALIATIAAAIPFASVSAEDTTKPEATDQTQEQKDCCKGMMGRMGKDTGNMMEMDMGKYDVQMERAGG
jgi:hypothetical protein